MSRVRNILCRAGTQTRPHLILASLLPCLVLLACSDAGKTPPTTTQEEAVSAGAPMAAADTASAADAQAPATQASAPVAGNDSAPAAGTQAAEQRIADKPIDARDLYNTYCAICHKAGLNAAPKYGNKILWARALAKGREKVYENAINGIRGMPARGGFAQLSDEEVIAATDYMVNGSGGWK